MKIAKPDSRSIAIMAAIILGVLALIYLGGLVGQLLAGYQVWLAQDGLSGGAKMAPIEFSPRVCFPHAFTAAGLKGVGIVLIAAGGLSLYIKLRGRFGGNDQDERNFARSKSGAYGTAGWMTDKEMKCILEVTSPEKAAGIILGQRNGKVICLPDDTRLNKHIAVFGASGTMKSRAVVRNYCFQAIRRGESVVITDPKSELYNDTAELFRMYGYQVKVFNLVDPSHGDSWNCMSDLKGDTLMAQVLTDVIITNTSGERGDRFWDTGEANLLKSLILFVDLDPSRGPEAKHLPAVYQMLTNTNERQLSAMFERLPLSHPAKAPYNLFAQASDTVRAGIIIGLGTRLQVLQNEAIRRITSRSDIDLTEPGKRKCAYFIILSDQDGALDFLSSLFFSFLFIKLVRYADSTPPNRCEVPVDIVLEELNNVGTIPDFARRLSTIRSRAIQVCMVTQNLAQLQNRYPNNLWAELIGNADTHLMLGCTDEVTAEYFSTRSGDMTIEVNSTMTVRQSFAIAQVIPQYRHTEGQGKRRLLTPDEVLRMPNDELLIVMRGQKMLKAAKFDYPGHPMAKLLTSSHISKYNPAQYVVPEPSFQTETENRHPLRSSVSPGLYGTAKPPDEF